MKERDRALHYTTLMPFFQFFNISYARFLCQSVASLLSAFWTTKKTSKLFADVIWGATNLHLCLAFKYISMQNIYDVSVKFTDGICCNRAKWSPLVNPVQNSYMVYQSIQGTFVIALCLLQPVEQFQLQRNKLLDINQPVRLYATQTQIPSKLPSSYRHAASPSTEQQLQEDTNVLNTCITPIYITLTNSRILEPKRNVCVTQDRRYPF